MAPATRERHTCRNTSVEVSIDHQDGCRPQVKLRVTCKCFDHLLLGEALYNPDRADALADEIRRLSGLARDYDGQPVA